MRALRNARGEMYSVFAFSRIAEELSAKLPPSPWYCSTEEEAVRVYRECRSRWEGPFHVAFVLLKLVSSEKEHGSTITFSVHQLLPMR